MYKKTRCSTPRQSHRQGFHSRRLYHQRSLRHGAEGYTNAVIKGVIAGKGMTRYQTNLVMPSCLFKVHSHKLIIKEPLS